MWILCNCKYENYSNLWSSNHISDLWRLLSYLIQVEVDYDEAGVGAGHEALEGGAVERVLVGEVLAHRARRVTAALKKMRVM